MHEHMIATYGGLLRTILSKCIFMFKVQNFHGQTQISMAKNCMFSFSAHVFMVYELVVPHGTTSSYTEIVPIVYTEQIKV